MEQVPQWLLDSVAAAGMTAYADVADEITTKNPDTPPDSVH